MIAFCITEREMDKQRRNIVSLAEVTITKKIHYQPNLTKKQKLPPKQENWPTFKKLHKTTIKLCPKLEVAQLWQRDHESLIDDFKGRVNLRLNLKLKG